MNHKTPHPLGAAACLAAAVLVSLELAAVSSAGGVGLPAHQAALLRSEAERRAADWFESLGDAARAIGSHGMGDLAGVKPSIGPAAILAADRAADAARLVQMPATPPGRQVHPDSHVLLTHLFLPPPTERLT